MNTADPFALELERERNREPLPARQWLPYSVPFDDAATRYRQQLVRDYAPRIRRADDGERRSLLCDLSVEIYNSYVSERSTLVKSGADEQSFRDLDTFTEWLVLDQLAIFKPDEREVREMNSAMSLCMESWVQRLRDQAARRSLNGEAQSATFSSADKGRSTEAEPAMNEADGNRAGRRAIVDSFLLRCNELKDLRVKVIRKHIWLAVGHKHPRQFQRWQAESDKATDADAQNFGRILAMSPAAFKALLEEKGII